MCLRLLEQVVISNASVDAGLCATCSHSRQVESDRASTFYLCERSASDPSFPKYPRLPVVKCPGYSATA